MDRKETEIKERVSEWLNTTALWQKILCFLQIILSAVIVVFAFMGLNDIIPIFTTNTVDLVLLAVLFVVSGVRLFPEKKLCTYIYFGVALLMLGILSSFLIRIYYNELRHNIKPTAKIPSISKATPK